MLVSWGLNLASQADQALPRTIAGHEQHTCCRSGVGSRYNSMHQMGKEVFCMTRGWRLGGRTWHFGPAEPSRERCLQMGSALVGHIPSCKFSRSLFIQEPPGKKVAQISDKTSRRTTVEFWTAILQKRELIVQISSNRLFAK